MENDLTKSGAAAKRLNAELARRAAKDARELAAANSERTQAVAERHLAEQALATCQERSRCYFELGLVGMAIWSPTKGCTEVNQRLCEILGYGRRKLMRMSWAALVHPDDFAGDVANYDQIVAGEADGFMMPKRWIHKNGDVVHTNVSVKCQRREDGSVKYLAAMIAKAEVLGPAPEVHNGLADHKELSGRERKVVGLIGSGRTVKEIAGALALSEKTVSTYRTRILTKLKLKNTAEIIRYAVKNRLAQ